MDPKIIAALIGSVGIFFAALLGYVGFFFKSRLEIKKSARKVLFILLEIRHQTIRSMFDPKNATKNYLEYISTKVEDRGYPMGDISADNPLHKMITTHFENLSTTLKEDMHTKLLEPYDDSLAEFATINPILAYRLRGKEKLEKVISHSQNYVENYKSEIELQVAETSFKNVIFNSSNNLLEESITELVKDLDCDILLLAKYCGLRDFWTCKQLLTNYKVKVEGTDFSAADHLIDNIIDKIIIASKNLENENEPPVVA
ncbi:MULTISPECIES: hypothetical protein [unclassified Agarivorans]|uniref:hypothetical protein n=1 Tax=unclassified Agarivorans TaxID=2636026 RepID=UPI003D7E90D7